MTEDQVNENCHVTCLEPHRRSSGEGIQCVVTEPENSPFIHSFCTKGSVKVDGGGIPVEDRPLESRISIFDTDGGERSHELNSVFLSPVLRSHVQVFKVNACSAKPRREIQKPDGYAFDLTIYVHDMTVSIRMIAEERLAELGVRSNGLFSGPFVQRQFSYERTN